MMTQERQTMRSRAEFDLEVEALRQGFGKAQGDRQKIQPAMISFYRRMDKAIAEVATGLACKTGCSYCCHYHVYISAPEAFALANAVDAMQDLTQRQSVLTRLNSNIRATAGLTVEQHIGTNIRCAFLSDDDACIVYSVRPGACRRHHSMSVEPCRETFEDTASKMEDPKSVAVLQVATAYMAASATATVSIRADDHVYELHGAAYEALTNKASLKRWRDGKTAFPGVRDKVRASPNA